MRRAERTGSRETRGRIDRPPRPPVPWGLLGFAAVIAVVVATGVVFLTIQLVVLPQLLDIAGTRPFDTRLGGYDRTTALALLKALGPIGRSVYLKIEIPLDTVFAVLYAISLGLGLAELLGRAGVSRRLAFLVAAVVILPVSGFDLAENAAISEMLRRPPDAVGADLVAVASFRTVAKWSAAGVALLVALLAGGFGLRRKPSENA